VDLEGNLLGFAAEPPLLQSSCSLSYSFFQAVGFTQHFKTDAAATHKHYCYKGTARTNL
jgi:hypothetical protein